MFQRTPSWILPYGQLGLLCVLLGYSHLSFLWFWFLFFVFCRYRLMYLHLSDKTLTCIYFKATKCSMLSQTVRVYAAAFVQRYTCVIVEKHQRYIVLTDAGLLKDFNTICVQKFQLSPQGTAFERRCPPSRSQMERRGKGIKWPLPEGREERSLATPMPPWVTLASSSQISPPPHIAEVSWDNKYVFLSKGSCN